jgi:UDP-N-acetylglucosamine 2-epimerase (non-hydrolysing)
MKIISVVGARPNFMKIAPFIRAIEKYNSTSDLQVEHLLVHTGQHYDHQMSQTFFDSLGIPAADIHLGVGSGSHAEQVGNTMIAFEKVVLEENPDWVVVVGDVNATLACSVTAKKLQVKCCHIEAGLRSGDLAMPEEINRIVTDRLSDLMLTPDKSSIENLKSEGIPVEKIEFVGNIMIDTLEVQRGKAAKLSIRDVISENLLIQGTTVPEMDERDYAVMTMHRPSNVDNVEVFKPIIDFLTEEVVLDMPLLWPIHPRARKQLELFGLWEKVISTHNLVLMRPIGYNEILRLNMTARLIISDSGGIQGESVALGIKCLILRNNTEWVVTLKENGGSSVLVGNEIENIRKEYRLALDEEFVGNLPELWDGKTAERCLAAILNRP